MKKIELVQIFSEEDKKFNRKMVDRTLKLKQQNKLPEQRGGKMRMKHPYKQGIFAERDYDFSSEILNEFRRKWGILR